MELGKVRGAAVAGHDAAVAAVVGLAHRRVHADLGRDAARRSACRCRGCAGCACRSVAKNAPLPGLSMTGSPASGASAGTMSWPGSPRIRMRPIGPGAPMRSVGAPRSTFARGASDRSGRWPSRVWMTSMPRAARRVEQRAARLDGRAQQRDVVAERLAEAAGLEEVALHVDDHERRRAADRSRSVRARRPPGRGEWLGEASRQGRSPSADVIGAIALAFLRKKQTSDIDACARGRRAPQHSSAYSLRARFRAARTRAENRAN